MTRPSVALNATWAAVLGGLAFLIILGFIIFFADTGTMPAAIRSLYAFPFGDKAGHFVLMGLLALALNLILQARRVLLTGRSVLLGSALAFLFVTLEEISQVFFRTRTLSLLDLTFSYLGILAASLLIHSLQRRRLFCGRG